MPKEKATQKETKSSITGRIRAGLVDPKNYWIYYQLGEAGVILGIAVGYYFWNKEKKIKGETTALTNAKRGSNDPVEMRINKTGEYELETTPPDSKE